MGTADTGGCRTDEQGLRQEYYFGQLNEEEQRGIGKCLKESSQERRNFTYDL